MIMLAALAVVPPTAIAAQERSAAEIYAEAEACWEGNDSVYMNRERALELYRQAAEMGIRVFTVGVGSAEGEPIPMNGELLKDKNGEIVVTRLDEEMLRKIADAGGGLYVRAENSEFGLNPIIDNIKKMDEEAFNSVVFEEFDEQYMYFFAIALVFFVIEMLIGERRAKRRLFN